MPAHNYTVLSDYNISHVVLCQRHHTCAHSPHVNYFQIPPDSDFVAQIKSFVSFVESLGRSNYTVQIYFIFYFYIFFKVIVANYCKDSSGRTKRTKQECRVGSWIGDAYGYTFRA